LTEASPATLRRPHLRVVVLEVSLRSRFMGELSLEAVWSRYQRAKARRRCWEGLWRDCYTYALPQRGTGFDSAFRPGANPAERLFDGTALDAVDQLGASLLAELTPPGRSGSV
jgi:hypothetical protein